MQVYHNNDYQPCSKRHRLVMVDKENKKTPVQRCTEPSAEHHFEIVSPDMCEGCPVRSIVTKAAIAKREYKPPQVEETREVLGVKADLTKNGEDGFPTCYDRQLVEIPSCCGATQEIRVCNSVDCFRMGSQVNPEMCHGCEHRRT